MVARNVRIGLIGCGGIMSSHISNYEAIKRAEIAALADVKKSQMAATVAKHSQLEGLPQFSDYRRMIEHTDLDGVVIATPHAHHFEQITACLEGGLHVLIEKPMVCTVEHARQVIKTADTQGKVAMIAYQRHFSPAWRLVRKMMRQGKLGDLTFLSALQAQDWLRWTKGGWRHDPRVSCGGQLNDAGSHLIDALLWATGLQPETVFAQISNRGTKVDILSGVTVRFKGGAIGTMSVVGDAPGWWEDIAFYGEKGGLYVRRDYLSMPDDQLFQSSRGRGRFTAKLKELTARPRYNSNADRNFVDSILGTDEPQTPAVCGLRVMQLTEAAWTSARTGEPVMVEGT
jgi:predicted dehydrogenase